MFANVAVVFIPDRINFDGSVMYYNRPVVDQNFLCLVMKYTTESTFLTEYMEEREREKAKQRFETAREYMLTRPLHIYFEYGNIKTKVN